MNTSRTIFRIVSIIALVMLVAACSLKKNTAETRFWHSFNTRYNVYYNGTLAYIDASLEKEKGNKDNYTEQIPLYTVGNKASKEIGKGNYDKAIEKMEKAIKLHSINAKPKWTKARPKNEKEIEFYSRKEYNPFQWKAWMLMGRSQFHKGAFDDAAATFAWMSRMYKTQPAIYGKARAWLAKCYIEEDWIYDAEDVIRNMERDTIHWKAQKEWDYTYCDYYLHTGENDKAAEYLRKVIKHEMRSKQRAREYFLLGQIEAAQGNKAEAYKAFRKVLKQNPPYELAFNARISMTEVLAEGQAKSMIGRLKRMARNDNNKDYLDQVYYAMGNIYLAQGDTLNAISAYEKGNTKATRSGIEKGVLLLHLGDLYWTLEKYGDAKRCYGEAIGLLDKDRKDYKELSDRSKVLDELVPFTDAIYLQDSLQVLAQMDEKDRNAAIDRVIDALKKKEKEERDKADEEYAQKVQQQNGQRGNNNNNAPVAPQANNRQGAQTFYFYNTQAVMQGKQAFEKQWGRRENADDWQRMNKTVVRGLMDDNAQTEEKVDSVPSDTTNVALTDSLAQKTGEEAEADSAANDPHKREYYLAQIPFTEEAILASNEIIKDGLFHSGIIFKDKLDNLRLSEKQFTRLTTDFPEFQPMDEVYYHLFLLYSRMGQPDTAAVFVDSLKASYPDSKWTTIVTDPYFEENARFGKHLEDSLYAVTYQAFLDGNYDEVMANTLISDTRFLLGDNRDKFLFFSGMSLLNQGQPDSCLARMERVVKEFPKSSVSSIAGMIINGVKEGRTLRNANFSMTDVWNRRTVVLTDADSLKMRTFTDERDVPHLFMYVFDPDSVDYNRLFFQVAKFNFTTFIARNFDLEVVNQDGLRRIQVSGFRSFEEARQYMRVLYSTNEDIKDLARLARPIVISDKNIPLLGTQYSYNDYDTFYVAHFQPLAVEREYMLYEPDEYKEQKQLREAQQNDINPALPSEQADPAGEKPVTPKQEGEDDDDDTTTTDDGFVIKEDKGTASKKDDTFEIKEDKGTASKKDDTFEIKDDSSQTKKEDDTFEIKDDSSQTKKEDDTFEIKDDSSDDKKKDNEDTFEVEDDKESTDDVEDEYYELDGF